jgi:hypothetical protein
MESDLLYYFIVIALICISVAGSVANLLVIVLISRNRQVFVTKNKYILALKCLHFAAVESSDFTGVELSLCRSVDGFGWSYTLHRVGRLPRMDFRTPGLSDGSFPV